MEHYLKIAQILRPVGIKGEVRARALADGAWRYGDIEEFYIAERAAHKPAALSYAFSPDGFMRVRIEGVDDRDSAESLRNAYICILRDQAPALEPDEYYHSDLIGCTVCTQDGDLGPLTEILDTNGASDVYMVDLQNGYMLFPALKKVICSVDIKNRRITLDADALSEVALYED